MTASLVLYSSHHLAFETEREAALGVLRRSRCTGEPRIPRLSDRVRLLLPISVTVPVHDGDGLMATVHQSLRRVARRTQAGRQALNACAWASAASGGKRKPRHRARHGDAASSSVLAAPTTSFCLAAAVALVTAWLFSIASSGHSGSELQHPADRGPVTKSPRSSRARNLRPGKTGRVAAPAQLH